MKATVGFVLGALVMGFGGGPQPPTTDELSRALGFKWYSYELKSDHPFVELKVGPAAREETYGITGALPRAKQGDLVRIAVRSVGDETFEFSMLDIGGPGGMAHRSFPNPFRATTEPIATTWGDDAVLRDTGVIARGHVGGLNPTPQDSDIRIRLVERQ